MTRRAIEVMAWRPEVPGSDRHVGTIRAVRPGGSPGPDLSLIDPSGWDWQDQGLCAETDPALFHPADGIHAEPALRICAACPVRAECLQWALANDEEWGVWGGTTERERQRIRAGRAVNELAA